MADDVISIEFLDDGRIKTENGKISAANHMGATQLFRMLEELAGGKVSRTKRQPGHVHTHEKLETSE
jgi:hypothetical protein